MIKNKRNTKLDTKILLSTMWIFAVLNYLYCDLLSLYEPGIIEQLFSGSIEGIVFSKGLLLVAAILMETAIVMVLLSRLLSHKWNRITNIIAGAIHTLSVFGSMFVGSTPAPHYLFFGIIEMITTIAIIRIAWKWKE